jgi:hypothetical protein
MKVLTFSTLYPNAARPAHGIFVETRLRQLIATGQVESKVLAPVPWFPLRHAAFGEYALHARAPSQEHRHGIEVIHPRYPLIPKIGMTLAPMLLAQAVKPAIRSLLERFEFDAIDAHYLYPDGVAAAILGKQFGKPVVLTARGTDVTLVPQYRLPRAMILWAARSAAAIITVSRSLKNGLAGLGVQGHKRRKFAGADYVAGVDPVNADADFKSLVEWPIACLDISRLTQLEFVLRIPENLRILQLGQAFPLNIVKSITFDPKLLLNIGLGWTPPNGHWAKGGTFFQETAEFFDPGHLLAVLLGTVVWASIGAAVYLVLAL